MHCKQETYINGTWNQVMLQDNFEANKCQLVFAFGATNLIGDETIYNYLRASYPNAEICSCSTSGEIIEDKVLDESVVVTALQFSKTSIKSVEINDVGKYSSFEVGKNLMHELSQEDLKAVFVLSEGTYTNGSELVEGLNHNKPDHIVVTGGLAGDAARFEKTVVGLNNVASEGNVLAIGFYGNSIQIGHSSIGGWDEFGRERIVTKSQKNILMELDNENALDLYKQYLGPFEVELPGSALLFPISLKSEEEGKNLVRTILSIDEEAKTMTFAGNLPEGSRVRLMKANFDKLIQASFEAATEAVAESPAEFALLVSCVGRKLILQDRIYEEVDAAREVIGKSAATTGFYSYGEISPLNNSTSCDLHNQTMTITTFAEL